MRVRLDAVERLAGPEAEAVCPIDPAEWRSDVEELEQSLDAGWEPPPLIVENRSGRLLLHDGNHRYQALIEAGETTAWTLVFFDEGPDRRRCDPLPLGKEPRAHREPDA